MVDDPITPPPSGQRLTCEFCECSLSSSGEVLKRSGKARAMIDLDDDNARLRAKLAEQETTITALRSEVETLKAAAPSGPSNQGGTDWDDD